MNCTHDPFKKLISSEHLFLSWDHFKQGKRKRKDIQHFECYLEDHIYELQTDLSTLEYSHGAYEQFYVTDPKQRCISKASVRDRLVHQAVYSILSEIFDKKFIFHSLSSRLGKGTHFGVIQLQNMIRKASGNRTKLGFALKMDIKRFFDSVDHQILKKLIRKTIHDDKFLTIIDIIIDSFYAGAKGKGIPLGNVTSQLFANIYLHELDHFIKHVHRERYYLRYCDDFIILSNDFCYLKCLITYIRKFLSDHLLLELHPQKIVLRKMSKGIDFIGYVLFPHHMLVRSRTKQRMKHRLKNSYNALLQGDLETVTLDQQLQSYLGILSHADQYELSLAIKNAYWVRFSY